ncbi:MAG: hypothetical protein JW892_17095 [Anaerolineae bacterium]|nr:hypothetical protein [Anaerolineae bacterium]
MNDRKIHIYASGRGFVIVPVCRQPDGKWIELQPLPRISLTRGRSLPTQIARAFERAISEPCTPPTPGTPNPPQSYLFAACLSWHEDTLQLHLLPDLEFQAEWPADVSYEKIADHLIAQLGQRLG